MGIASGQDAPGVEAEAVFGAFVRNCNACVQPRPARVVTKASSEPPPVPLTRPKARLPIQISTDPPEYDASSDTQVTEGSEDGQIPAGELVRVLLQGQLLAAQGRRDEVRARLDSLCQEYPEDLLLLRRVAEFHLEHGDEEAAMEALFVLSGRLFERRNVRGMREALEQVLILQPGNQRAYKLLGLLQQRPVTGTGV